MLSDIYSIAAGLFLQVCPVAEVQPTGGTIFRLKSTSAKIFSTKMFRYTGGLTWPNEVVLASRVMRTPRYSARSRHRNWSAEVRSSRSQWASANPVLTT